MYVVKSFYRIIHLLNNNTIDLFFFLLLLLLYIKLTCSIILTTGKYDRRISTLHTLV